MVIFKSRNQLQSATRRKVTMLLQLQCTKDDVLTPHWAREMAETCSIFSYTGGERAERHSHTSQRSAAPAVAAKMVAVAMAATGVTAVAAVGLENRRWRRW